MVRILIGGFTENTGGMESYIMNIYRIINKKAIQFDFLRCDGDKIAFEEEIRELGGQVFYVPRKKVSIREHYSALKSLFLNNHYDGIYFQTCHKLKSADVFRYAKKYGVKKCVMHSHNTDEDFSISALDKIRINHAEKQIERCTDARFACSKEAGKWMFGNKPFEVINNGIHTDRFKFDQYRRDKIREEIKAGNKKVYGTVGRLSPAKNPEFIIDVFNEIYKQDSNSMFIHIGGGELDEQLKEKVNSLNLQNSYLFLGVQKNVEDYLSAMDIFLLPSIFEGFPISLVEAQCSGLYCVVSDTITKECDIIGKMIFLSIKDKSENWSNKILRIDCSDRKSYKEELINKGYDIEQLVGKISDYFIGE